MKVSKVAAQAARGLFALCNSGGVLDEGKVRQVVSRLTSSKPRDYHAILVALQRLIRLDLAKRQVSVTSAIALTEAEKIEITTKLNASYGAHLQFSYHVDSSLLGGLKIRVGDDVLDGSVSGRIQRLEQIFQS